MKHEPGIFDDHHVEAEEAAVARARASYAAGAGVDHRIVAMWLRTWGSDDERSFGEWLAAWNV